MTHDDTSLDAAYARYKAARIALMQAAGLKLLREYDEAFDVWRTLAFEKITAMRKVEDRS